MAEEIGRLVRRRIRPMDEESGWSSGEFTDAENDATKTAKEPGVPPGVYHHISWKVGDEIIKKMQAERMSKDEEIPSFWNYDPRCLPKEFVDLDKKTFLVDPSALNICFLDKDILRRISKMLIPMDFLNLSYTCRYLHWRLFTFSTCYVPYRVLMKIRDQTLGYYEKCDEAEYRLYKTAPNKIVYSLILEEDDRLSMPGLAQEEGRRAIVARIPSCLRKPFFFDHLYLSLHLPFFTKDDFDRCLALIMPIRKYIRELHISINYYNRQSSDKFFDYQAANTFLQALNVASYYAWNRMSRTFIPDRTLGIFENCPYARLMDRVDVSLRRTGSTFEDAVFLNRIGRYLDPPVSAIIQTINEFRYGTTNLTYHQYEFRNIGKQAAFLDYFFANYLDYEEYYHEYVAQMRRGRHEDFTRVEQSKTVRFVTVITEETGRKHMMRVSVEPLFDHLWIRVAFGIEKGFATELRRTHQEDMETCRTGKNWWRMETAIEPEEEGEDKEKMATGGNLE